MVVMVGKGSGCGSCDGVREVVEVVSSGWYTVTAVKVMVVKVGTDNGEGSGSGHLYC